MIFLKLFPFVLTTFSLLGGFTKGLWELYNRRNSSQVFIHLPITSGHFRDSSGHFGSMTLKLSLIVDGIEEAVSELFAGLGLIYQKMEKERSMNETCLRKCFYKNSQ